MKKTRLIGMLCAVAMALTLVLPVGAVGYENFTYTHNGQERPLGLQTYDANGRSTSMKFATPRDVTLLPGEQVRLGEMDGSALVMSTGEQATAHITLAHGAPLEIGYTLNDGPYQRLQRNGASLVNHSASFSASVDGNYRFIIKNIGSVNIVLTAAYVDIVGA